MRIFGEYDRQLAVQADSSNMACAAIKTLDQTGDGSKWVYLSREQVAELIFQLAKVLAEDTGERNG